MLLVSLCPKSYQPTHRAGFSICGTNQEFLLWICHLLFFHMRLGGKLIPSMLQWMSSLNVETSKVAVISFRLLDTVSVLIGKLGCQRHDERK